MLHISAAADSHTFALELDRNEVFVFGTTIELFVV